MAIKEKDVYDAADKLLAEGVNPSQLAVRKILGSGSNTTISEYLKSWREKQAELDLFNKIASAPPERITAVLEKLSVEVWSVAQEIAAERLKLDRDEIERLRIEQDKIADDIFLEYDALSQKNASLEAENKRLSEKLQQADIEIKELLLKQNKMHEEHNKALLDILKKSG